MTISLVSDGGSATIRPLLDLAPSLVDDPQTQSWKRGMKHISRTQLVSTARAKINTLLRLDPGWDSHRARTPAPIAGLVLNGILERLLFDDCATPQIAPLPDGGLEVDWLVGGNSLHAEVSPEGVVYMDARTPEGEEFADEFPYWQTDNFLLSRAETFLKKISEGVEIRLLAP